MHNAGIPKNGSHQGRCVEKVADSLPQCDPRDIPPGRGAAIEPSGPLTPVEVLERKWTG